MTKEWTRYRATTSIASMPAKAKRTPGQAKRYREIHASILFMTVPKAPAQKAAHIHQPRGTPAKP